MKIVSLVPSWTETLVEAGLNVVGRTRFCIHPGPQLKAIPIVGGTKDLDWEKVKKLAPDVVLMDREENPRKFAEECPFPWIDTHVTDLSSLISELRRLSQQFNASELSSYADRFEQVLLKGPFENPQNISALTEQWGNWTGKEAVLYVIWKNPWMVAGPQTFIGSMLRQLGFQMAKVPPGNYPEVTEADLRAHCCLFSSEPYPFAKKPEVAMDIAPRGALIDGESISWFGIRSLRFLEAIFSQKGLIR